MAEQVLHCAGCNVSFRAKTYDPAKTYKCPKCGGKLQPQAAGKGDDGVTLESKAEGKRAADKDPLVGRKIGQYKILKKLGEGGMGAVYQAVHLELDRTVALKILPPRLAQDDPDAIERFKREARSAAVLNHPNVVTTHNVGSDGEHHFIEQEFVDGQSLQQRLEREGKLPVDDATRIVQDAAGALAAAHKQNIIHRDIKPANIMLTSEGQVKVMDFGLAKNVTGATQLTVSGHIMGTPYYMSPEQCEAKKLDGRSDIYSLGVTYFYLLTGDLPFKGDSCLAVMLKHKAEPPPDPRAALPSLPNALCQIVQKAMAKAPGDRYQTCEEMIADLEAGIAQAAQEADSKRTEIVATPPAGTAAVLHPDRPPSGGTPEGPGAQPPSAVDRGRDAEAAEGRSHRVPGSAATMAHAGLDDVIDTAAERDRHLHTRRIDHRLRDVRAFAKHWASLSEMVKRARKKGKPSDKQMREFADVRDFIARRYAEVMKRLEDPTTPGHRVVSACRTAVTLDALLELPQSEYEHFVKHLVAGAELLRQYVDFLAAGKRDLLRQSVWYFYWDKYLHNPKAAAAVLVAGVVLACVIGWQVAAHWPKGEKTSTTEVTESTEKAEAPQSALRTPQSAIPSVPSVVKSESAIPIPQSEIEDMVAKIRTYFPTPAMKEAIRRLIAERRKPFNNARVITVRQDGKGDFKSIQAAVDAATQGDTIEIQDSATYHGPVVLAGECLRPAAGCTPRIVTHQPGDFALSLKAGSMAEGMYCAGGRVAAVLLASSAAIFGCTVGRAHIGVQVGDLSNGSVVAGCVVCASDLNGIYARACREPRIVGNLCLSNAWAHINVSEHPRYGKDGGVRGALLAANLVGLGGKHGIVVQHTDGADLFGNCVVGNPGTGIVAHTKVCDSLVLSNIVVPDDQGVHFSLLPQRNVLDFNVLWGETPSMHVKAVSGEAFTSLPDLQARTGFQLHGLWADPKFVDPANYDFRLRPDSPCRGAGPGGTDIGIAWDADADYFYKLLTTPIEQLIEDAKKATQK